MGNSSDTKEEQHRAKIDEVIQRAQNYMLSIQNPEGFWWEELESNPTIEAEYLMLCYFLGVNNEERYDKIANHILDRQLHDGSWAQYYKAPGNLSTSVECYFALKLAGVPEHSTPMVKARGFILAKGGIPRTHIFTRIWLALLGQYDWNDLPAMPPELMLLPHWFPFNIYEFSSWARATIVPLLIVLTNKPIRAIPAWAAVGELYPKALDEHRSTIPRAKSIVTWRSFFHCVDWLLRAYEKSPIKPGRTRSTKLAENWILAHQQVDGSWGGLQPPWVYSLIALKHLGYELNHPVIKEGLEGFEKFGIEKGDTWRVQPHISPVWDTCLSLIAMLESAYSSKDSNMAQSARWLINQQILQGGDWQVKAKETSPGGWAFEFDNNIYPNIDDTAEVILALNMSHLPGTEDFQRKESLRKGVRWLLGLQSKNGGWAAFDKNNNRVYMSKIPFADFGEVLDPPSADVTSHVMEALGQLGYRHDFPPVARAYKFIRGEQEEEGCWFGKWGANYIYGTGAVLPALEAVGENMGQQYIRKAVAWIKSRQNSDGGWGESCASYVGIDQKGKGPSTPSQTSWALMGLLSAGETGSTATLRGIEYLAQTQRDDGSWDEPYFTATGFTGYRGGKQLRRLQKSTDPEFQSLDLDSGFMINYHMYRNCWPLTALGRYRRTLKVRVI